MVHWTVGFWLSRFSLWSCSCCWQEMTCTRGCLYASALCLGSVLSFARPLHGCDTLQNAAGDLDGQSRPDSMSWVASQWHTVAWGCGRAACRPATTSNYSLSWASPFPSFCASHAASASPAIPAQSWPLLGQFAAQQSPLLLARRKPLPSADKRPAVPGWQRCQFVQ